MSLRFSIIKNIKTTVGGQEESVVFEYEEHKVLKDLRKNVRRKLPYRKDPIIGERRWTENEVIEAVTKGWEKTVGDFKKITVKIL